MTGHDVSRPRASGGCLCGAVKYRLHGPLRPVVACHCAQCLRSHGHYASYTGLPREGVELVEDRGLTWYRSSETARRGFCALCGSSLFWDRIGGPLLSVAAGSLDAPTGLKTLRHIFVEGKADYYELIDDLEKLSEGQSKTWSGKEGKL